MRTHTNTEADLQAEAAAAMGARIPPHGNFINAAQMKGDIKLCGYEKGREPPMV